MTLNRIVCAVLLLMFSVVANAADRKYIVKPRASDAEGAAFQRGGAGG